MDADGGTSKYPTNTAGAKYGTGYCDSQCPHDIKFINGQANNVGWTPATNSVNTGTGKYGSCCNEMDIWEANSISEAYTPHPCTVDGQYRCGGGTADDCGDTDRTAGVCDKSGCDFNSYRNGVLNYYGPGMTIDTTKKITVVTQFLTSDGTASGALTEIRRFYVQNGVSIANSHVNLAGVSASYDSVTAPYCADVKAVEGDTNDWLAKGGMGPMDKAFVKGMVLVLSIWDDYAVNMLWLDSDYPTTADPTAPGVARGTCPTTSGVPSQVESQSPNSQVTYSNIKIGPIGSTAPPPTGSGSTVSSKSSSSSSHSTSTSSMHTTSSSSVKTTSTTPHTTSTTKTTSSMGAGQTLYGQCAGNGYTGPTNCLQGTCKYSNPWYSQCLN
jgi:cellulose 1,4-beta-cellobiosidase